MRISTAEGFFIFSTRTGIQFPEADLLYLRICMEV